jgi:virginiamycin B lyase
MRLPCCALTAIYWTNNLTGPIGRANLNGTAINQNFITGAQNLIAVTLHGDYIYRTNVGSGGLGNAPIGCARLDEGMLIRTSSSLAAQPEVAVEGKQTYWTNEKIVGLAAVRAKGGSQNDEALKHFPKKYSV